MSSNRLVADRKRGLKRKKKVNPVGWLCNPQVLKTVITGARLAVTLVRLVLELVGITSQH